MTEQKRIKVGVALGFAALAVLVGWAVAVLTVGATSEFVPGTGVFAPLPAGSVGSGLHLPLGGGR